MNAFGKLCFQSSVLATILIIVLISQSIWDGMYIAIFVYLSTSTKIELNTWFFQLHARRLVIKSIVISLNRDTSEGKSLNCLYDLYRINFTQWQYEHVLIYCLISALIFGQKYFLFANSKVWTYSKWLVNWSLWLLFSSCFCSSLEGMYH